MKKTYKYLSALLLVFGCFFLLGNMNCKADASVYYMNSKNVSDYKGETTVVVTFDGVEIYDLMRLKGSDKINTLEFGPGVTKIEQMMNSEYDYEIFPNLTKIVIGPDVKEINLECTDFPTVKELSLDANNTSYKIIDGMIYNSD